ncbi:hypothetical protein ABS764_15295 [Flavobacterium sp. ST-87]|uniref:Uncharacterized protein n=1 Tax=Flavobacterium plantiphilum TaxID=3163297 RepID=A0ABW8XYJ3_9FLAO
MKTTKLIIAFLTSCFLTSCFMGAGTLGGFDTRMFPTSKRKLVQGIDTLFSKYPNYKIPDKWKSRDDWKERGYDFLDSRIFYFPSDPEEMYYVTFYGDANDSIQLDTTKTGISIRAVENATSGWTLEDNTSSSDKKRIEARFDKEIISKLEQYTGTKATREK